MAGILDLTPEDKQGALNMGLLQAGLGILARNTDRVNPMPALGAGGLMGIQGYQEAMDRAQKQKLLEIEKARMVREAEQYKMHQDLMNDPSTPEPIRQMLKAGVPAAAIFTPHVAPEGSSLMSVGAAYGMGGTPAAAAGPEQLSGPGMPASGTTPPTPAGTLPPGVIAQGAAKPMVNPTYPVGDNQVQPHISFDRGVTWQPVQGTKPQDKFAPGQDPQLEKLLAARDALPPGHPNIPIYDQMIRKLTTHPNPANQNVTIRQESAFEGELGKGQADALLKGRGAADDAVQIINTVNTGRKLLNEGMVTGAGANVLVALGQGMKQVGLDLGQGDATANAQAYVANMAQNVGKIIKQFGSGTGLSDADREYAQQMAGGKINLDEQAIRKILDINEKAARNLIRLHNTRAAGVKTNIPLTVAEPADTGGSLGGATPLASQIPGPASAAAPRVRRYNPVTKRIE